VEEDSIQHFGGTILKDSPANAATKKLAGDATTVTSITLKDLLANAETKKVIGDA